VDETNIFGPYWDGHASVYADPIRIHYRLFSDLDGDPNTYFDKMSERGPDQASYREKVEKAVRRAFDLTPFDRATGEGLNQAAIIKLLDRYIEYQDEKKVSGSSTPTSPLPTISTPPSDMKPGTDLCSTCHVRGSV
jgi:hypothetical protein